MISPTPGPDGRRVTVTAESTDGHVVLHLAGILDAISYRSVRGQIVEAALEQPRSVVVDVDEFVVPRDSAWAVFTAARWLIYEWPGVPLALVCSQADGRQGLVCNGSLVTSQYMPTWLLLWAPSILALPAVLAADAAKGALQHRWRAVLSRCGSPGGSDRS